MLSIHKIMKQVQSVAEHIEAYQRDNPPLEDLDGDEKVEAIHQLIAHFESTELEMQNLEVQLEQIDIADDSSDDEEMVEKKPYVSLSSHIHHKLMNNTSEKLSEVSKNLDLMKESPPLSHQVLLRNGLSLSKEKSLSAPLLEVKTVAEFNPNQPALDHHQVIRKIVPTFRGLFWSSFDSREEHFYATRASLAHEGYYSTFAYRLADIEMSQYVKMKFYGDGMLLDQYEKYDLEDYEDDIACNRINAPIVLFDYESELKLAHQKIENFFECAQHYTRPFNTWLSIFDNMRRCKDLMMKGDVNISLKNILSYIYINDYKMFLEVFADLKTFLLKLDEGDLKERLLVAYAPLEAVAQEKKCMPFVSEGNTPRHALLYGFGLKLYSQNVELNTEPLYEPSFKPKNKNIYRGKLLVINNPSSIFEGGLPALNVCDFNLQHGGTLIGKTIVGEKEIQHVGANLKGKIDKSINLKLPKFHHKNAPQWYLDKYGLDKELYLYFKTMFQHLSAENEYGKNSWVYLETILLSHLVHFHEQQLYKWANKMGKDSNARLMWSEIKDPIDKVNAITNFFQSVKPK